MSTPKNNVIFSTFLKLFLQRAFWTINAIRRGGTLSSGLGLVLVAMLTVLLILGLATSFASAKEDALPLQRKSITIDEWTATGTFTPEGTENENLFTVTDAATGSADGFGAFTFARLVLQDGSIVPPKCATGGGNTSIQGAPLLIFADGVLFVEQTSGQACVDYPVVQFDTQNKITDGTGRFKNAKGKLTIKVTGNLDDYTSEVTFSGKIEIKDD